MELFQIIRQHILTTVVVILVGILVGGGLGILYAWLFRLLYKAKPGLHPPLMLLPWRTILFALVLFCCSPMAYFVIGGFGSQELTGVVFSALVFMVIVFFFVADGTLTQWLPARLGVRLTGLVRTFAVACGVIVAIGSNAVGSGILHYARIRVAETFNPEAWWTALGVVMGMGLVFDLVLGSVQMLLAYAERRKATMQTSPLQET